MSYQTDVEMIFTTVNVNTNVTGDYLIGTVAPGPSGTRFCPLIFSVEPIAVSGTVTNYPTISVGTVNPNYADWFGPYDMNTITPAPPVLNETLLTGVGGATPAKSITPGTDIFCQVSVASTDSTYTLRVSITGIYYHVPTIGP